MQIETKLRGDTYLLYSSHTAHCIPRVHARDAVCQIRQESQYVYRLLVTDFHSCGVAKKDVSIAVGCVQEKKIMHVGGIRYSCRWFPSPYVM